VTKLQKDLKKMREAVAEGRRIRDLPSAHERLDRLEDYIVSLSEFVGTQSDALSILIEARESLSEGISSIPQEQDEEAG
tara:strand:- start:673 stop:909 length:237 start_codon:yes stop_codon:yes gene_type:complete